MEVLKKTIFSILLGAIFGLALVSIKFALFPDIALAQVDLSDTTSGLTVSNDTEETVASLVQIALGFLGVISVVIILMGGFKWMTSSGNSDTIKEAQTLIFGGVIGLAVIVSAWAITSFVVEAVVKAVG